PSVLAVVAVVWVVPRIGPIVVKTISCGALTLPEACLEICLEAWSLCFFACGVRWVKFPCFVILDFGSVLSVGSHGWRQSVDTKVGRSLISQQKRFTKTHLAVHNIKQREDKSVRAFATRTRNLVEHLSTNLPSTYKGLMETTCTWIEAREVATNGAPNDRRNGFERSRKSSWDNDMGQKSRDRFSPYWGPNHGLLSSLSKSLREILTTVKVAKTFK
ncbi:hypothetical protein Tco_0775056, partial [Tanacetum coccineum]